MCSLVCIFLYVGWDCPSKFYQFSPLYVCFLTNVFRCAYVPLCRVVTELCECSLLYIQFSPLYVPSYSIFSLICSLIFKFLISGDFETARANVSGWERQLFWRMLVRDLSLTHVCVCACVGTVYFGTYASIGQRASRQSLCVCVYVCGCVCVCVYVCSQSILGHMQVSDRERHGNHCGQRLHPRALCPF